MCEKVIWLQSVACFYYKVHHVLQSVNTIITKCGKYYYETLLRSAWGMAKSETYYKAKRSISQKTADYELGKPE